MPVPVPVKLSCLVRSLPIIATSWPQWAFIQSLVQVPRSQSGPGGARRGQEEQGGARRSQEGPGGARGSQEGPGGFSLDGLRGLL